MQEDPVLNAPIRSLQLMLRTRSSSSVCSDFLYSSFIFIPHDVVRQHRAIHRCSCALLLKQSFVKIQGIKALVQLAEQIPFRHLSQLF